MSLRRKFTALFVCVMTIMAMSLTAFAESGVTESQNVTVSFKSDKEQYSSGDKATFTVTVTNNNDFAIKNFSLGYTLPETITTDKSKLPDTIELIGAGETKTLTFDVEVYSETAGGGLSTTMIIIIAAAVAVVAIVVIVLLVVKKKKKPVAMMLVASLVAGGVCAMQTPVISANAEETTTKYASNTDYKRAGVHDPSIVKDPSTGTYYVFGSHRAFAKSTDLYSWTSVHNNVTDDYQSLFSTLYNTYCYTAENSVVDGNMWAPDVIYNETMGKWCMYMSLNGNDWHSVIVLLTADNIEGPYELVDGVMYSGFQGTSEGYANVVGEYFFFNVASNDFKVNSEEAHISARVDYSEDLGEAAVVKTRAEISDVYKVLGEGAELGRYNNTDISKVNAIDPNVQYDDDGNLWMTYGSWSAGIYQIKLDNETGLRDYDYTYESETNKSDPYLGYKIAGGRYNSGEAPYLLKTDDYYYLFVSIGNLEASGGYNMRVYRSESINGPYVDENGQSAITTSWTGNLGFREDKNQSITSKYNSPLGIKLMGAYDMYGIQKIQVAQGHNSAFVDDDGKMYVVYHSRFADSGEGFEVRVHQLFETETGWLAAAPYEYSGETYSDTAYDTKAIAGTYDYVLHDKAFVYAENGAGNRGIAQAVSITLTEDGKITGDKTGTWALTKGNNVKMTIDNVEYSGVFIEQENELSTRDMTMTFTLVGGNQCVWGVKNPEKN